MHAGKTRSMHRPPLRFGTSPYIQPMRRRSFIVIVTGFLFVGPVCLHAQDYQMVEAYRKDLREATDDTARAEAMAMICYHLTQTDPDSARWYGERALELARRTGHPKALGDAWNNLGWLDATQGRTDSGEARISRALAFFERTGNPAYRAIALSNLGNMATWRGDQVRALQHYREALKLSEGAGDSASTAVLLYSIGIAYRQAGEPEKAMEHLYKAREMEAALRRPTKEALCLIAIANGEVAMGDTLSALRHYNEAFPLTIKHHDLQQAGLVEENLGLLHSQAHPFKALGHFERAMAYYDSVQALRDKAYVLLSSAQVRSRLGHHQEALSDMQAGKAFAASTGTFTLVMDYERAQAELAGKMDDAVAAVKHFTRYIELKDSLQGEDTQRELARLRTEFETERKEKDNELLRAENRLKEARIQRRNVQLFGLVAFALMAVVAAALYRRNFREKRRSALMLERLNRQLANSNAEISEINSLLESRLLRSQMNPHFIFNALGSAMQLASSGSTAEAVEYLQGLAKLLRMVLDHSVDDTIGVDEEVEFLKQYLRIEAYRMPGLTYTVTAEPALLEEDAGLPALVVQPFVENALGHGLADKTGERRLEVRFARDGDDISCTITDNGIGREAAKAAARSDHRSLGMQLTADRIRLLSRRLGKNNKVEVEDLFGPDHQPAGTRVVLRLAAVGPRS